MILDASSPWRAVIPAGLGAAVVDALYFSASALLAGTSPVKVLNGIAGFWLGKAASTGGAGAATLGLATHLGLAIAMAAGFVRLRGSMILLQQPALVSGVIYGLLLYAIMYGLVLPLRWPAIFPAFAGWTSVLDVVVHLAVGVTIAAIVGRFDGRATGV